MISSTTVADDFDPVFMTVARECAKFGLVIYCKFFVDRHSAAEEEGEYGGISQISIFTEGW
jgi:hypothetical protein